jgi:pyruvate-ferredoxin/flavodoxin oxidoreductase
MSSTTFPDRYDMSANLIEGGTLLINTPFGPDKVWETLPAVTQKSLIEKKAKLFVMMPIRLLKKPAWEAASTPSCKFVSLRYPGFYRRMSPLKKLKLQLKKPTAKKEMRLSLKNITAVDKTLECLFEVSIPAAVGNKQLFRLWLQTPPSLLTGSWPNYRRFRG